MVEPTKVGKDGSWDRENYVLEVTTATGKTTSMDFYSAYGDWVLYATPSISPSRPGQLYSNVVLITAAGKGTSVTHYTLNIYAISNGNLESVFSKEIADYFGVGEMWWYIPHFEPMKDEFGESAKPPYGLTLALGHDPIDPEVNEDPREIPNVSVLCIAWEKGRFKEIDGKRCSSVTRPATEHEGPPDVLKIPHTAPPGTASKANGSSVP